MTIRKFIIIYFLIYFIHGNPIDRNLRLYENSPQQTVNNINSKSFGKLFKKIDFNKIQHNEVNIRTRRSEIPIELRPVEGPINIEQLPAMLAARNVKRYPYSQQFDPAIIG